MPQNICCRRTFAPDITTLCSPDVSPAVYYLRQGGYVFVVVCLFVSNFAKKTSQRICMQIFREGWQWASEQMIKFWWRSGSPSKYRNCFPDSSPLGDTESGINRLRCATLQGRACTSRHRHSNYDVITSPAHDREPRQPVMVNDIATLVRRALAEVCTVPVILIF